MAIRSVPETSSSAAAAYLFRFEGVSASQDTIAKNSNFKPHASLVVIIFIGLRDAYYIKLVSGAKAAIRLLSLRDTQSVPGKRPSILRQQQPARMDPFRAGILV